MCLTQKIRNQRGDLIRYIEGCVNKTDYSVECKEPGSEKCNTDTPGMVIPDGMKDSELLYAVCQSPTMCEVTIPGRTHS